MKAFKAKKPLLTAAAILASMGIMLSGCISIEFVDGDSSQNSSSDVVIDSSHELSVHYIDVGQADCIFISMPDGSNMMIDTGNRDDFSTIDSYLTDLNIDELDSLVLTHPHEDHIGSAADVIKKYTPEKVYMPDSAANTRVFENTLMAAVNTGCEMITPKPGDCIIDTDDVSMEVLAPVGSGYDTQNNYSIVTRLVYNDCSFLFTGDAETISEDEILSNGYDVDSDVLKVGHHGSSTSSSQRFLDAVSPEYAVIMCGVNNDYGHPHRETLQKFKAMGLKTYRTDKDGSIVCRTDGKNIAFGDEVPGSSENKAEKLIGNKNSKIFHTAECGSNISEKNRVYFSTYAEADKAGYSPCNNCKPPKK